MTTKRALGQSITQCCEVVQNIIIVVVMQLRVDLTMAAELLTTSLENLLECPQILLKAGTHWQPTDGSSQAPLHAICATCVGLALTVGPRASASFEMAQIPEAYLERPQVACTAAALLPLSATRLRGKVRRQGRFCSWCPKGLTKVCRWAVL